MTISGTNLELLKRKADRFEKRMCPECQMETGDLTIEELDILLRNNADALGDMLLKMLAEEARKN